MAAAPRILASLALAAFALAPAADAADWRFGFGKRTRHGHVSVGIGHKGTQVRFGRPPRGYRHHGSCCHTLPGHYETVQEKVWIPGYTEQVWVPARVEVWYDYYGCRHETVLEPGHYRQVHHPGHYELRARRVWVPGRTVCRRVGITPY